MTVFVVTPAETAIAATSRTGRSPSSSLAFGVNAPPIRKTSSRRDVIASTIRRSSSMPAEAAAAEAAPCAAAA